MSVQYLTTYQTLPLDPTERKIRVLHLLPGTGDDICVELSVLDLENLDHEYTCVSYVWGDVAVRKAIWVDSEQLSVTTNLYDLLQHVRHPRNVITLWVDAVCINQEDIKERSHQVALMDVVYSRCASVYIWLGQPQDVSYVTENPFYFFEHFAEGKHYHDLPGYHLEASGLWTFDEQDSKFQALWTAFSLVAENAWWTRAWTVQEVILPRQSTIHLGNWQTTYETISLARIKRNDQLGGCCAQSRAAQSFAIRHKLDHFLGEIARIDLIHYPRMQQGESEIADILKSRSAYELPALYQVALSFAARRCKDPRDKVFSILGLAEGSVFTNFRPDYSAAVKDCYTDFFARMVDWSGGDHRVLLGTGFGPNLPGMPSWVRDFSTPHSPELIGQEIRRLQVYNLYDCSGGKTGRLQVVNGKELKIKAIQQDVILTVGLAMGDIFDDPLDVQHVLNKWVQMSRQSIPGFPGDERQHHNRLSRTLCADLRNDMSIKNVFWRRATANEIPDPVALQQLLSRDLSALDDGFIPGVAMSTAGRALYITESGNIGLCNPKARQGDVVAALIGSNVPFVLRKVIDDYDGQNAHQLIGDCFLFGGMDGEIIRAGNSPQDVILV